LPDLEKPFIDTSPSDLRDVIPVGELGIDGGNGDGNWPSDSLKNVFRTHGLIITVQ
jgi:hypothetical protein